jgi:transcriptional regulator with XRE-family HTH domain
MAREHGTYNCYVSKCPDCPREDQKAARSAYDKRLRKAKAYGRHRPFVDAGPVREHVNRLRDAGFGSQRIADLAGVPYKVLSALIWGVEGMKPSKQLRPWTAEKLLALQPAQEERLPWSLMDPTGSQRRLQALQAVGWTQAELSERLGMVRCQVGRIITGRCEYVRAETAWAIRGLYDTLWDAAPPETTPVERRRASIARRVARDHGWVPPLAWDDETIDDPAAEPEGVGRDKPSRVRKLPPADDIHWLIQGGDSVEVIAARYDAKPDAVRQSLHRYRNQVSA